MSLPEPEPSTSVLYVILMPDICSKRSPIGVYVDSNVDTAVE
eukprot:CAMPEP_0201922208 /NCGR_PEP_ID=MMETSP0903-20130614/10302_1 /ASSEMBLY_ACC=CAM_ASM_000552 /TAXON_ID=420261 /ORGANISM="Thalassiosira antarctica, Strain CCMP982" /LENGTH=41 /DNA_ID= /DNA_START= /DNA_END= /DNA_ORIENTATION=